MDVIELQSESIVIPPTEVIKRRAAFLVYLIRSKKEISAHFNKDWASKIMPYITSEESFISMRYPEPTPRCRAVRHSRKNVMRLPKIVPSLESHKRKRLHPC